MSKRYTPKEVDDIMEALFQEWTNPNMPTMRDMYYNVAKKFNRTPAAIAALSHKVIHERKMEMERESNNAIKHK